MSLSSTEIVHKLYFKNKAEPNQKIKEVLNELGKNTNIYKTDSIFETNAEFLYLHPTRGTHWTLHMIEYYGCVLMDVHHQKF